MERKRSIRSVREGGRTNYRRNKTHIRWIRKKRMWRRGKV